jgi:hypothetical protein
VSSGKELRRYRGEIVSCSPGARIVAIGTRVPDGPEQEEDEGLLPGRFAGPRNGTVRLLEIATGKELALLKGCSFWIKSDRSISGFYPSSPRRASV